MTYPNTLTHTQFAKLFITKVTLMANKSFRLSFFVDVQKHITFLFDVAVE